MGSGLRTYKASSDNTHSVLIEPCLCLLRVTTASCKNANFSPPLDNRRIKL